jgi:organic hydroperoxide reductase OsmC/OhrA
VGPTDAGAGRKTGKKRALGTTFTAESRVVQTVMADIESTTTNDSGFHALSRVGDFELSIDATTEEGPSPNEVLVADYASCYTFAFRAGAQRNDYDDLGKIQTDASAALDEDDDLESVRFDIHVETELDADEQDELKGLADDICHVHAAVREGLKADVSIHPSADL